MARLDSTVAALPDMEVLGPSPGVALMRAGDAALQLVAPPLRDAVAAAIGASFHAVFYVGAAIALLSLACVLLLEEVPLKTTTAAAPADADEAAGTAD
jgi:hypothetical protein